MEVCKEVTDEDLIRAYREKQDNFALSELYKRYNHMIKALAHHYFLLKSGEEDLLQEGRLGFFKAVKTYDSDRPIPFAAFAKRCVRCQYISAIKTANRQKHRPLNTSVSLHAQICLQDSDVTFMDILTNEEKVEASDRMVEAEDYKVCDEFIEGVLSCVEFEAVMHYLSGKSYDEIADSMDRSVKSVDNALQRAKNAIRSGLKKRKDITLNMLRHYFHELICNSDIRKY